MQNVCVLSSETNELIQVTPSSALRSTTPPQSSARPFSIGKCKPSGKVRCTTYRGISVLLVRRPLTCDQRTGDPRRPHREDSLCWTSPVPILDREGHVAGRVPLVCARGATPPHCGAGALADPQDGEL